MLVALCLLGAACSGGGESAGPEPAVTSVPDGTTHYWVGGPVGDPGLMILAVTSNHVTGSIVSDPMGGCGAIDGSLATGTIAFPGGRRWTYAATWWSTGTMHTMSLSDGSQVIEALPSRMPPETHAAADYGVSNAASAAVVVSDNSASFAVSSVRLRSPVGCLDRQYGAVPQGGRLVLAVPPGPYHVEAGFLARSGNWLCKGTESGGVGVTIEAGRAAVFSMDGGSACDSRYQRPDLVKK